MAPVLTKDEIDALAVPKGCTAGPRPSDPDILVESPWKDHLPLAERQAEWRERDLNLGRRMVAALARRHGWSEAQVAAAESVTLDIPSSAIKNGRSYPADAMSVYVEAARRAA